MRQLLFILLYNAVKYTNSGFIHLKLSASKQDQSPSEETQVLTIKIQDSGCGMSEEQTQKLFKILQNIK